MILDLAMVVTGIVIITALTVTKKEVLSNLIRNSLIAGVLITVIQMMIFAGSLESLLQSKDGIKEEGIYFLIIMIVIRFRPLMIGLVFRFIFIIIDQVIKRKKPEVSPPENEAPVNKIDFSILSRREIEVARLAAKGYTNSQIAEELFISPETVKRHMSTILEKLNMKSRKELMMNEPC